MAFLDGFDVTLHVTTNLLLAELCILFAVFGQHLAVLIEGGLNPFLYLFLDGLNLIVDLLAVLSVL